MKKFIFGLVVGLLLPAVAGYLFVTSGGMPVSTKAPPLPFEKFIARASLHAAYKDAGNLQAPFPADETHLVAGANVYRHNCAGCHGVPGGQPSRVARGMFPPPPQLFKAGGHGVTDDPAGETYLKTKNGIRLTGMPGFVDGLSEEDLWNVSLFLKNADKLPAKAQEVLNQK